MFKRKLSLLSTGAILAAFAFTPSLAHSAETHSEAIQMSWDSNENYVSEIGESFVGIPLVVPGDSAERTLTVLNDGPSEGELRVSIINVDLQNPDAPDMGNFYDDVSINTKASETHSASLTQLSDNTTTVVSTQTLGEGETTDITIGFDFPAAATSGNTAFVEDRKASFDVLLEIGGELPDTPQPPDDEDDDDKNPGEGDKPGDENDNGNDSSPGDKDRDRGGNNGNNNNGSSGNSDNQNNSPLTKLPRTGAEIFWAVVISGALVGLGATFMRLSGRKKD